MTICRTAHRGFLPPVGSPWPLSRPWRAGPNSAMAAGNFSVREGRRRPLHRLSSTTSWNLVGEGRLAGRLSVVNVCRGTATEKQDVTTKWLRSLPRATVTPSSPSDGKKVHRHASMPERLFNRDICAVIGEGRTLSRARFRQDSRLLGTIRGVFGATEAAAQPVRRLQWQQ